MKLDIPVPEVRTSSNSKPISLSISTELEQEIKNIKKTNAKLFNDVHRSALEQIVRAFQTGEVFKEVS